MRTTTPSHGLTSSAYLTPLAFYAQIFALSRLEDAQHRRCSSLQGQTDLWRSAAFPKGGLAFRIRPPVRRVLCAHPFQVWLAAEDTCITGIALPYWGLQAFDVRPLLFLHHLTPYLTLDAPT
jgi:hypothetical protein